MTRLFRLFVSSTFEDLQMEREALHTRVFPELAELCLKRGARFQPIDLRWGVSEEAGRDQRTMQICFEEIARCQRQTRRPNFLVLLGDRYGWRPVPTSIPADEFAAILDGLVDQPADRRLDVFDRLREVASAVPGVASAAISFTTPTGRAGWNTRIVVPPDSPLKGRERSSWINAVSPGWFRTYGIPIAGGRDFDARDRAGAPRVANVNRAFARRFLKNGEPLGQH